MKEKVECIMLIDDSPAVNFYHKSLIEQADCCQSIVVARHGKEALDILTDTSKKGYHKPDLIFLDLNMPVMDGWEFLDHYKKLQAELKAKALVVLVSSSLNPDDKEKAAEYEDVKEYIIKPIDLEVLEHLLKSYF